MNLDIGNICTRSVTGHKAFIKPKTGTQVFFISFVYCIHRHILLLHTCVNTHSIGWYDQLSNYN